MDRRNALRTMGGASVAGLVGLSGCTTDAKEALDGIDAVIADAGTNAILPVPDCVLTGAQAAGPFYFNVDQVRRDITEGRAGIPLRLLLTVVDVDQCLPLVDALVDIWHTDADGLYSGYTGQADDGSIDTRGEIFMRGLQVSDSGGQVEFSTIYPGWYISRTAHIHVKVHLDNQTVVTSQLYFPEADNEKVYALPPYSSSGRGQRPTNNTNDGVVGSGQLEDLLIRIEETNDGYNGFFIIGVRV